MVKGEVIQKEKVLLLEVVPPLLLSVMVQRLGDNNMSCNNETGIELNSVD